MYQAFKALQKAPRVRKDAFTLRRPQLTRRRWECPAFLHTSSTTCAGPVPHVNFGHLAQDFKGALFRHQALLQCITLHTSAAPTASSIVSFPLAQTGEGIKECELTEWYVQAGSRVEEFEKICEVQSDKAAVEITSRYPGVIKKLHHSTGDLVQVGSPLVDIEVTDAAPTNDGSKLQTETVPKPPSDIDAAPVASVRQKSPPGYKVFASPATKHLAKENNINLADVTGTGPEGRITREDLLKVLEQQAHSAVSQESSAPSTSGQGAAKAPGSQAEPPAKRPQPPSSQQAAEEEALHPGTTIVPLRGYKRAMVKSMIAAGTIPHFHLCDELDMRALMALRNQIKGDSVLQGVHLTFLPIMIKALSTALEEFPLVNSSLNSKADALLQHSSHNIGVAMATPSGLVVPNIKNVQQRNVANIAAELARLQKDAAIGRVNQADVSGGTISVSNIGTIGGTYATPLVNPPEVAIVALGRVRYLPRFAADGEVEKAALLNISWGADHRVLDGATLAEFSNKWKQFIEEPDRLLLRLR
ncbi:hypothetical protein ABBQ38_010680 [Trebouxia sp. C0009 RCD-2024]